MPISHDVLINEIENFENFELDVDYLCSLKPKMREMWQSFYADDVQIDYGTDDYDLCYLLRYYPSYSEIIESLFNHWDVSLDRLLNTSRTLNVKIFGGGACPELYGLVSYISNHPKAEDLTKVNVEVFDYYLDGWEKARDLTCHMISSHFDNIDFCCTVSELDFNEEIDQNILDNLWGETDIIIFQHFFNELDVDSSKKNLEKVLDNITPSSLVLFVERPNYDKCNEVIDFYRNLIISKEGFYREEKGQITEINENIPSKLKVLFDGSSGLILAKKIDIKVLIASEKRIF